MVTWYALYNSSVAMTNSMDSDEKTSHVQKQLQPFKAEKHHLTKGGRAATRDQQGESEGNAHRESFTFRE